MTSYATEAAAVAEAMNAVYENKQQNKKDNISGDFSSDTASYPTVKAVKGALEGKLDKTHTSYKSKNVVTDSSGNITFEDKPTIPDVSGKIDTAGTGLSKSGTTLNHSNSITAVTTAAFKKFKYDAQGHITGVSNVTSSDLPSHSHSDYVVTVEQQSTAETGYAATYVVKQGGSQVGSKINIPKDFLVKSGEVKSCTTANNPVQGYVVGDKYIDFVINAKDSSATAEHMYILVSDLVEDTTYTADGSTLQLSNGQFSVKSGGIGTTQLSSSVNTSLGYADAYHSSPAAGITSSQILAWDTAASGGLTTEDVQDEISAFATALAAAINPSA